MKRYQVVGLIGAGLVVLGSFLPWVTIRAGLFSTSVAGTDSGGDGVVTAVLGGIAVLVLLVAKPKAGTTVAVLVGLAAGGTGAYDFTKLRERAEDAEVTVSPGVGLAMLLLGAMLLFSLAFLSESDPQPLPPPSGAPLG